MTDLERLGRHVGETRKLETTSCEQLRAFLSEWARSIEDRSGDFTPPRPLPHVFAKYLTRRGYFEPIVRYVRR